MEPADMNHCSPEKQIDDWLRSSTDPHLPDDGFTQRVLSALPPRKSPILARRRPWLILGGFVAGTLIALRDGAPALDGAAVAQLLGEVGQEAAQLLANPSFPTALTLVLFSLVIAYWQSLAHFFRS